jgi:type II secretory pathway predicted ATPase ExeA
MAQPGEVIMTVKNNPPDQHRHFAAYFGFLAEPFSKDIAAKSLFISKQLKALFARLRQLIARRGLALITGEVGSGKSTAIRAFAESLEKNQFEWVYIDDPTIGMRGLWSSVAAQLGLNIKFFKWQLLPTIKNAIEKNFHDDHKTTVLVIDDAHLLKPAALEELRLFTNFRIDSHSPMLLILLAQPEFRKFLHLKALEAFSQRLVLRAQVTGLEQNEVKAYIQHHLTIAGRTDPLFTDEVITEIFHHAKGLPRVINTLCYDCLWEIYELQKNLVDLPTLERVLCRDDES